MQTAFAVVLAWAFDVNSGTVKRTAAISASQLGLRGPRLALLLVAIGLLAASPGLIGKVRGDPRYNALLRKMKLPVD